jgi:outer membrane immunogenic protein
LFQPPPGVPGPAGVDNFDVDGFIGGGHLGYNYQIQQFVLGIEGDLD